MNPQEPEQPQDQQEEPQDHQQQKASPQVPARRKPRVLIADDDVRVLELLQFVLAGNGFEVLVASDGEEACEVFRNGAPDLAVVDLKMPRRTGFDVLDRIRGSQERSDLPVILISGSTDTELRLAGLVKGADDFLTKPFSPKELLLKCRRLLQRAEQHHSLHRVRRRLESEMERVLEDANRLRHRLDREMRVRDTVVALGRDAAGAADLDHVLNSFLITVMGQLGLSSASLYMTSLDDGQALAPRVSHGVRACGPHAAEFRLNGALAATLVAEGRPLRRSELEGYEDLRRECGKLQALGAGVVAPVLVGTTLVAMVLGGERADGGDLTREDLDVLRTLCASAGAAIESARLFRDQQQEAVDAIGALVSAMESKDPFGRGHTDRVADYAVMLARALDRPAEEVEQIRRGAMLHDIGKIGVEDDILNKPGRLSPEELMRMQEHPLIGSSIVRPLRCLASAHDIVRHHHERVDGAGYPDRLRGEDYGMGARIVSVADSFDAMTTDRPYRPAMTVEEALAILREQAGTQYDATVVETLIAELQAGRIQPIRPQRAA